MQLKEYVTTVTLQSQERAGRYRVESFGEDAVGRYPIRRPRTMTPRGTILLLDEAEAARLAHCVRPLDRNDPADVRLAALARTGAGGAETDSD